ncbi:MAG: hypothetical protein AAGH89_14600 [Verrucomicrobiota bacterium]
MWDVPLVFFEKCVQTFEHHSQGVGDIRHAVFERSPIDIDPAFLLGNLPSEDKGGKLRAKGSLCERVDGSSVGQLPEIVVSAATGTVKKDENRVLTGFLKIGRCSHSIVERASLWTFPGFRRIGAEFHMIRLCGDEGGREEKGKKEEFHPEEVPPAILTLPRLFIGTVLGPETPRFDIVPGQPRVI